jgi:Zn-dependent M28 family amino/carboxypeptidase
MVSTQEYVVENKTVKNIEARLMGRTLPGEIVIVGAHYDSVAGSPGANDNATGVAALLEIARFLTSTQPARSVRFVAFVNEESPFFFTRDMGSRRYASWARAQGENIVAMLSLETIGYYADTKGSQRYPFVFRFFYPDVGNFVGFVGNLASRALVQQCIASFRSHTFFPSEGLAAPWWIPGISWSDHSSFWREGYPAIMVTDTAPFRYPHYHTKTDTPEQIDFDRLARVVSGLARVTLDVAREDR